MNETIKDPATKRTVVACNSCRKGKRKCDGVRPVCSECRRHTRECIFTITSTRPKSRKVDKHYVKRLEEQVKTLTTLIDSLQRGHGGVMPYHQQKDYLNTASADKVCSSIRPRSWPSSPVIAAEELSDMQWKLSHDNNGITSFLGPTSLLRCSARPSKPYVGTHRNTKYLTPRRRFDWKFIQDKGLFRHLATGFLRSINPYFQFTDPAFLLDPPDMDATTPDIQACYSAMISLGTCFSNHDNAIEIGEALAIEAEELIMSFYRTAPTVYLVQSLSILALRDLSLGRLDGGWGYLSKFNLAFTFHATFLGNPLVFLVLTRI